MCKYCEVKKTIWENDLVGEDICSTGNEYVTIAQKEFVI